MRFPPFSLWEEAEELLNEARGILEEVVEMHALKEIMEEPKLQSIYVQGVSQLAKVLLLIAELRLINRDPATSYVLLRQAHHLTGFMRGTPQVQVPRFQSSVSHPEGNSTRHVPLLCH